MYMYMHMHMYMYNNNIQKDTYVVHVHVHVHMYMYMYMYMCNVEKRCARYSRTRLPGIYHAKAIGWRRRRAYQPIAHLTCM